MSAEITNPDDQSQVRNPESGRWISRTGAAYKKLVSRGVIIPNAANAVSPNYVPGDLPKVLNEVTGRMISTQGAAYKKLVAEGKMAPAVVPAGSPSYQAPNSGGKDKVYNPKTKRWIEKGGAMHKKLIKEGMVVVDAPCPCPPQSPPRPCVTGGSPLMPSFQNAPIPGFPRPMIPGISSMMNTRPGTLSPSRMGPLSPSRMATLPFAPKSPPRLTPMGGLQQSGMGFQGFLR